MTGGVVPPSAAHTFPATGTFYWAAFYSGDHDNLPAASNCATEPLVVLPALSRITTELSAPDGQIPGGGSVTDAATLHDVTGTAGGTVQYRFYDSLAACDTDVAAFPGTPPPGGTLVSTVPVTGGVVPPSAAQTFGIAGLSTGPRSTPATQATWRQPASAPPSRWKSRARNRGSPRG